MPLGLLRKTKKLIRYQLWRRYIYFTEAWCAGTWYLNSSAGSSSKCYIALRDAIHTQVSGCIEGRATVGGEDLGPCCLN